MKRRHHVVAAAVGIVSFVLGLQWAVLVEHLLLVANVVAVLALLAWWIHLAAGNKWIAVLSRQRKSIGICYFVKEGNWAKGAQYHDGNGAWTHMALDGVPFFLCGNRCSTWPLNPHQHGVVNREIAHAACKLNKGGECCTAFVPQRILKQAVNRSCTFGKRLQLATAGRRNFSKKV